MPAPASVADTEIAPDGAPLSSASFGGVVSLTQNRNANGPAAVFERLSKTTSYQPGSGSTAPAIGRNSSKRPMYGLIPCGSPAYPTRWSSSPAYATYGTALPEGTATPKFATRFVMWTREATSGPAEVP